MSSQISSPAASVIQQEDFKPAWTNKQTVALGAATLALALVTVRAAAVCGLFDRVPGADFIKLALNASTPVIAHCSTTAKAIAFAGGVLTPITAAATVHFQNKAAQSVKEAIEERRQEEDQVEAILQAMDKDTDHPIDLSVPQPSTNKTPDSTTSSPSQTINGLPPRRCRPPSNFNYRNPTQNPIITVK